MKLWINPKLADLVGWRKAVNAFVDSGFSDKVLDKSYTDDIKERRVTEVRRIIDTEQPENDPEEERRNRVHQWKAKHGSKDELTGSFRKAFAHVINQEDLQNNVCIRSIGKFFKSAWDAVHIRQDDGCNDDGTPYDDCAGIVYGKRWDELMAEHAVGCAHAVWRLHEASNEFKCLQIPIDFAFCYPRGACATADTAHLVNVCQRIIDAAPTPQAAAPAATPA